MIITRIITTIIIIIIIIYGLKDLDLEANFKSHGEFKPTHMHN